MMVQDIENKIIELLEVKSEALIQDTNVFIQEIGLDSIQYIELLVEIEQIYSIEFEEDKLFGSAFERLSDLIKYVDVRVSEANK